MTLVEYFIEKSETAWLRDSNSILNRNERVVLLQDVLNVISELENSIGERLVIKDKND